MKFTYKLEQQQKKRDGCSLKPINSPFIGEIMKEAKYAQNTNFINKTTGKKIRKMKNVFRVEITLNPNQNT